MRFEAASWLGGFPRAYFGITGLLRPDQDAHTLAPQRVTDATEIVIEGFPRSGNTFATTAFAMAQGRPVAIAHHRHAAAQIIEGVRRRLPCILLIREPEDAVASLLVRHPVLSPRQALRRYVLFHKAILPCRTGVVVADFARVTGNFSAVIEEVNRRFGTRFAVFRHDPASVAECFRLIEERNRRKFGHGEVDERSIARPSRSRSEAQSDVKHALARPALRDLVSRARSLYASFVG